MSVIELDTGTIEETTIVPDPQGEHDLFAHIVMPASAVTEAYILGTPVTALCGKSWVPTRDPNRYKVCQTCVEILGRSRDLSSQD